MIRSAPFKLLAYVAAFATGFIAECAYAHESTPYISPLPLGSRTVANDEGRFVKCLPPTDGAPADFDKLCSKFLDDVKLVRVARPSPPLYKHDWIRRSDYKALFHSLDSKSSTVIKVTIAPSGAITDCAVVSGSGVDELDRAACSVTIEKAKFFPRIDQDGNAVESTYSRTIVWKPAN